MDTTTRLLLPFTGSINALALSYAIQMAEQRHATLVPLALIPQGGRLEHIQQAQDFLEFTRRKAERQGVPIEPARIYTGNAARTIEAFSGEMNCEAVILFLSNTNEVLLEHAEIRELMDHSNCNMHIVLLPEKRRWRAPNHPVHMPIIRRSDDDTPTSKSGALLQEQGQEHISLVRRFIQHDIQPGK